MDTLMLQRDEATRDRVRQAIEFLDPRMHFFLPLPAPRPPLQRRQVQYSVTPPRTQR